MAQVKADIFEREIRALDITETGALAAALLAGKAIGVYDDLEEAVNKVIKPRKKFYPQKKFRDIYRDKYKIYKGLYPALKDINHKIMGK